MLTIGTMLASFQSEGTWPRFREIWKILISTGVSSFAAVFNMKAGMESGPAALSGRRLWRRLRTPASLTVILGMSGKGLLPLLGMLVVSSSVKTDLNWCFTISALLTLLAWRPKPARWPHHPKVHQLQLQAMQIIIIVATKSTPTSIGYTDNYHRHHQKYITYNSRLY